MASRHPVPVSPAGILALVILLGLLAASGFYAVNVWMSIDARMNMWGWSMLVLGAVFTIAIGAGLMFLVFYSARHDMDR